MIFDSHTHVFTEWPKGPFAEPEKAGSSTRLESEMKGAAVGRALLVSVIYAGGDSNAISLQSEHAAPERFVALPSLDSMGSATYHTSGADIRLEALHRGNGAIRGFVHYCRDYEWLEGPDANLLFTRAAGWHHIVSIAVFAPGLAPLARVAKRFPTLTFLVHHLGRLQEKSQSAPDLAALAAAAAAPNIWFKLSGFHHLSPPTEKYPYRRLWTLVRTIYDTVGPARLVWGSDFPVVEPFMSYRQSVEIVFESAPFLTSAEQAAIFGGNLTGLLAAL